MNLKEVRNYFNSKYLLEEKESVFHICATHLSGKSKLELLSQDHNFSSENWDLIIARLNEGEPIQYITGKAPFMSLNLSVDKQTLIPRPETEELVDWMATAILDSGVTQPRILDIGTGSGCIALGLKHLIPHAEVHALDCSEEALKVAKRNSEETSLEVEFHFTDILIWRMLYPALPPFDFIVSNPPYVLESDAAEMSKNVLDYEPELALFVEDDDPLLFYEKIVDFAGIHLNKDGGLYFEIHEKKGGDVLALMAREGFIDLELKKDLQEKDRMIRGRKIV